MYQALPVYQVKLKSPWVSKPAGGQVDALLGNTHADTVKADNTINVPRVDLRLAVLDISRPLGEECSGFDPK